MLYVAAWFSVLHTAGAAMLHSHSLQPRLLPAVRLLHHSASRARLSDSLQTQLAADMTACVTAVVAAAALVVASV